MMWYVHFFLCLFLFNYSLAGHSGCQDWDHHEVVDKEGKYNLYWSVRRKTVNFCFDVATTGWIGFGITDDGSLSKSDVVIGWVKKDKGYLYDYHGDNTGLLIADKSQDWKLQLSSESKSRTILEISRDLDTCDPEDRAILDGKQPYIFVYSDKDLESPGSIEDVILRFKAGWQTKYLALLQAKFEKVPMTKDLSTWDVRANKFRVPGNTTDFFYCKFVKAPRLKQENHIVKVAPIITTENEGNIIYILVNPCVEKYLGEGEAALRFKGGDCSSPDIPDLYWRCWNLFSIYLIRTRGIVYPQFAGAPIGGENPEYYLHVIFYNNPKLRKDIVDSSGLRHYYTPKLRPFNSALLWGPGTIISPLTVIPPKEKEFTMKQVTPSECLSDGMPEEGVNIFAVGIDLQLLGRRMKLRHFRGNKELPVIIDFQNYNPFDREYIHFERSVKVLPGDRLMAECTFDSSSRNTTTLGGFPFVQDYCNFLLFHYPPMPYLRILSSPSIELIAGLTGMDLSTGRYNVTIQQGYTGTANQKYIRYLENYKWSESKKCIFEESIQKAPQFAACSDHDQYITSVPHVSLLEKYVRHWNPDPCKKHWNYRFEKRKETRQCNYY